MRTFGIGIGQMERIETYRKSEEDSFAGVFCSSGKMMMMVVVVVVVVVVESASAAGAATAEAEVCSQVSRKVMPFRIYSYPRC